MECKTKWALKRMNEWTRLISGWIKQIYCNCFSPLILAVQRCLCLKLCLANDITCAITWYIQIKNQNWKNRLLKSKFRVVFRNEKMAWKAKNQTICLNAKQQKQQKKKWQLSKCSERKFSAVQCHGYHVCTWHLWTLIFFEFSPQTGVYVNKPNKLQKSALKICLAVKRGLKNPKVEICWPARRLGILN